MKQPLLLLRPEGLYCPQADVFLDPFRGVDKALISHAHADHARAGSKSYLCVHSSKPLIHQRLGAKRNIDSVAYGEKISINGVDFSFHPAGHIPGSAQIRVEYKGEVWVFTGDFKPYYDGLAEAFEPVECHTLITECTFGAPYFQWEPRERVMQQINDFWRKNAESGFNTVLLGYSIGKSQAILKDLDASIGAIWVHPAVGEMNEILEAAGTQFPPYKFWNEAQLSKVSGALFMAPPGMDGAKWLEPFTPFKTAMASGWMAFDTGRGGRIDGRFVMSDHSDWPGLIYAAQASNAERVLCTHGDSSYLVPYLNSLGIEAHNLSHWSAQFLTNV